MANKAEEMKKRLQEKAKNMTPTQALIQGNKEENGKVLPINKNANPAEKESETSLPEQKDSSAETPAPPPQKNEKEQKPEQTQRKTNNKGKPSDEDPLEDIFKKKKTMEETHKRVTYLVKKETLEDIDELLDELGEGSKGAKTRWINQVLKNALEELKDMKSKRKKK